jgi:integrase
LLILSRPAGTSASAPPGPARSGIRQGGVAPRPVQTAVVAVADYRFVESRRASRREFAEQWWIKNEAQLRPGTHVDYRWRLEKHLLPSFAEYALDAITFDLVERYIAAKLAERDPISPRSINMTLTLMAAILEGAVERELISRNPAKGKSRRAREREPKRSYLDTAAQIAALLDAAGELDRGARQDRRHVQRRAIIATLTFAGLRIGELCALRWRDVDLAGSWLHVTDAKTDAGVRRVKLRGALRDELLAARSRHPASPDEFVFATRTGGAPSRDNVRNRVLAPAVERANASLVRRDLVPLPERITPHSLRRPSRASSMRWERTLAW